MTQTNPISPNQTGRVLPAESSGKLYFLHALGKKALPERIFVDNRWFKVTTFIKHDFFAATGFYQCESTGQKAVLKISRTEPFLGLPNRWIGRLICNREMKFYHRLRDLPNVPPVIGRVGDTGFLHGYVEGRPLEKDKPVPDGFFDEMLRIIDVLYARGIAIVDTNKPENILLGSDGQPHLIDFQISFDSHELGDIWPATSILKMFRRTDIYHILKHKKRLRPDELTEAESKLAEQRGTLVNLHRKITKPYFIIRRKLFGWLRDKGKLMPEGSK